LWEVTRHPARPLRSQAVNRAKKLVAKVIGSKVMVSGDIELKARTRLVLHWALIAVDQTARARAGRAEVVKTYEESATPHLALELHPAMIAIAACAHSLDGLYAELAEHVAPETLAKWEETRRPRAGRGRWADIAAILELSVERDVEPWRAPLKTLFEDRNRAVHPKAKFRDLEDHPALGIKGPAEYTVYCVETAEESLELLLEILSACVETPKPSITGWADETRKLMEGLRLRAGGTQGEAAEPEGESG
jgi:hypothetical protein